MSLYKYSFKDVDIIWANGIVFNGMAPGDDALVITSTAPQFIKVVGVQGDISVSQSSDNSCSIAAKFLYGSSALKLIRAQYLVAREGGILFFPMLINNKISGQKQIINNAWIVDEPSSQEGAATPIVTVTFDGDFLTTIAI